MGEFLRTGPVQTEQLFDSPYRPWEVHNYFNIKTDTQAHQDSVDRVTVVALSLLRKSRRVTLRKVLPCTPPLLNNILLHRSRETRLFYGSAAEIIEDSKGYLESI